MNESFEPRRDLLDLMQELNGQVLPLATFFVDRR